MIILSLNSPSLTVKKKLKSCQLKSSAILPAKNRHRFTACALSPQDSLTPEIPIQNVRRGCWDLDSNNWGIGWGKSQVLEVEIKKPWQLCRTFTNTPRHQNSIPPSEFPCLEKPIHDTLDCHHTEPPRWSEKWRDCCYPATSLFRSHKWLYGLLLSPAEWEKPTSRSFQIYISATNLQKLSEPPIGHNTNGGFLMSFLMTLKVSDRPFQGASNWCTEESPLGWGKQRKGNIQLFILGHRHRVGGDDPEFSVTQAFLFFYRSWNKTYEEGRSSDHD